MQTTRQVEGGRTRARGASGRRWSDTTGSSLQASARLVTAVKELSLARDLHAISGIGRRAARELTGADGATFVVREGDLCYYLEEEAIEPPWTGRRFPLHLCIGGWVIQNRRPAIIEDVDADPRFPAAVFRPTSVRSLAMVPIRAADPVGAIGCHWTVRRRPASEEVGLLCALADSASVALENMQLHADLQRRLDEKSEQLEAANQRLREQVRELRRAEDEVRRLSAAQGRRATARPGGRR